MQRLADIYLKKNEERRIEAGHLWVFSNEVLKTDGEAVNGDLCQVYSSSGKFLGTGVWNRNSLICVRILSREKIEDIREFLRERILSAAGLRSRIYTGRSAYRLLFGESDGLPGLVADRYNDSYILQIHSAGMEALKDVITGVLRDELQAKHILTRHDMYFRKLEGLSEEDEILLGTPEKEVITIEGVKYQIDFRDSQKTGFFLDQAANRIYASRFTGGGSVLDLFCNSGGFGLHALKAGAREAVFSDISETALAAVRRNYELNGFSAGAEYIPGDAFIVLKELHQNGRGFDLVVTDPPAFVKSRKRIQEGVKGYLTINALALKLVKKGGFYATASCSHHITREVFLETIHKAALKAGRELKLLHFAGAGEDHPVLPAMPETEYLKFGVFAVL